MRIAFGKFVVLVLVGSVCSCLHGIGQDVASDSAKKNSNRRAKEKQTVQLPPQPEPAQTLKQEGSHSSVTSAIVSSAKEPPASSEPTGSFSELTLFLFASGLALFIALLGWSDQIRAINKDTKEMESHFLEDTGMQRRDFLRIIKPTSADEQLEALTEMVNAGKFKTKDSVQLLQQFTKWQREWSKGWPYLERLTNWKYNLTITLTIALLIAGTISLFTSPAEKVTIGGVPVRVEMLVLMLPMAIVALLLGIIICIATREKALRALLNSMSELT